MSTFEVGATTCTFTALEDSFDNDASGPVERFSLSVLLEDAAEWSNLYSLRSWDVAVETIPAGSGQDAHVDYAGGAGEGTLSIDEATLGGDWPKLAIISEVKRTRVVNDGRMLATFLVTVTGVPA